MKAFTTIVASAFLGICAMAGDPLFQDGRTRWTITLPPQPAPAEQYAAEELQNALKKISGAQFPIRKAAVPGKNAIIIGSLETSEAVRAKAEALKLSKGKTEELAVYTLDGNLYLAGNQDRGALYAVYTFLRTQLGARWFWPGDDGEFLPEKKTYTLPSLQYNYKPPFRFREMTPCWLHNHVPTEIWLARNFMNGGSRTRSVRDKAGFYAADGGHWVSLSKKEFSSHPDFFSLIDGKRVPEGEAGCWSNPEFTKKIVQAHIDLIDKQKIKLLNTFPADITQRCQCAECTKNPDPSSRWFQYYSKLIREIRKVRPEVLFAGIAYQEYRAVPAAKVENLEYVEYCQYNRCYVHKLNDPACELNRKSMDELRRWQEKAPMGIYGYEFDVFKVPMYLPFWNMLAEEMKHFRDLGLVRMKTELSVQYPENAKREEIPQQAHRLSNYLYAQLMWNPDADVNTLLKDWCDTLYGPGGTAMLAYHQAMAKAWDSMKIHLSYFGADPGGASKNLLSEELIRFAETQFRNAREQVRKTGNPELSKRHLAEIDLEAALFRKWENAYKVARENAVTACLVHLKGENRFAELGKFPMKSRKGTHLPTETRMYWTDDALHLQAVCMESNMKDLRKGRPGRDVDLWSDDSIEIFLGLNDGSPYRQFAVNPAGGTYDGLGSDKTWNPEWSAKSELRNDRWIMTIRIPFASLGKTPAGGEQWQITVIRNSKPEACGFPVPAHLDLSSAANLYFSANSNPDYRGTWISSPALGGAERFGRFRNDILKNGWQFRNISGPEKSMELDLSDSRLILIENYQNNLPMEFYRDKLIPAVRNGAVAVFSCYFWVDKLHEQFNDPTYQMKFVENASSVRKPSWIAPNSFANTPHEISKVVWHTPSGNFIPAHPEKWEALLKQKTDKNEEMPFVLARPLGKGMVVLTGDIGGNIALLENILEYNKAIRR